MKLPRYWAKATVTAEDQYGRQQPFSAWGWSDVSRQEAAAMGQDRARRLAARLRVGDRPDRYLYHQRPLREEILETFTGSDGQLAAAITRNSYGCQVLNTAAAMFVDVDLPEPTRAERLRYHLARFLGRRVTAPQESYLAAALARLETFLANRPGWGARAYRTPAGLRYLFIHATLDPGAESTREAMAALGADPLYVRLCQAQESFRARLTPKPWRCGLAAPRQRWPWADAAAEHRFQRWQETYRQAAEPFAACRFMVAYGRSDPHPDIAALIRLHDTRSRALLHLPLA